MKTLIVSDIHIGNTKMTKVVNFIEFIKKIDYDVIIFNGDIIDFLSGDAVKEQWKYVKEILKIVKGKKVYYLPGNHDKIGLLLIPFGWLFGIKVRKMLSYGRYHIEHGDWIEYYLPIMKIFNKSIVINNDDFHANAVEFSKLIKKPIIVGHSHSPKVIENCLYDEGNWTIMKDGTTHRTYIIIDENNNINLHEYTNEI